jgi:hypothetical protein
MSDDDEPDLEHELPDAAHDELRRALRWAIRHIRNLEHGNAPGPGSTSRPDRRHHRRHPHHRTNRAQAGAPKDSASNSKAAGPGDASHPTAPRSPADRPTQTNGTHGAAHTGQTQDSHG